MKKTKFDFFKNTPLTDFINTIHFSSNSERDRFFLNEGHYDIFPYYMSDYNFIRDRLHVRVYCDDINNFLGVNYCTFKSEFEELRYYAFIVNTNYLNDRTVDVTLVIDTVMTFTQGNVIEQFKNLTIQRQHLDNKSYKELLPILRTNNDILQATTKQYIEQKNERFLMSWVVFQSSVDLTADWGDENNPHLVTSNGSTFDRLTSPVNLYACDYSQFPEFMKTVEKAPWVAQNITKILMLPFDVFIGLDVLKKVKVNGSDFELYLFKDGGKSINKQLSGINYTMAELLGTLGLNPISEKHLFRSGYCTLEVHSWDGQTLILDPAFINDTTGLIFMAQTVLGYKNEIRVFPLNYQSADSEKDIKNSKGDPVIFKGTYLGNALVFNNWTELPLLIDNYKLGVASNSNQRALAQSRLLTNRVSDFFDPTPAVNSENIQNKLYNAVNIVSDLSIGAITGKLSDEYEYYQNLKAQQKDMQLSSPSITASPDENAFQIANDMFGFTLKISFPSEVEMTKIKNYYRVMGHSVELFGSSLAPIDSMEICNYVQFTGNYTIPNIPNEFMDILKPLFENGVRLWHNNHTPNPMTQDITKNEPKF